MGGVLVFHPGSLELCLSLGPYRWVLLIPFVLGEEWFLGVLGD